MRAIAAIAACVLSGACSTIIEGRNQQIVVNTNPAGADCGLYRQGLRIATVQNAPGSALIEKTKYDIWVVCVKQGYQQATYFNHSGVAGATVGNIILGGGIGWIVDSATGSDNKYDSPVNMTLVPVQPGQPEAPASLPGSYVAAPPQPIPATQQPPAVQQPGTPSGPVTN
jgi:hypothetical protein